MNEYSIGRCSRRCRVLDRPLQPGERFYSVAVTKGGEIVRYDVAASEWNGPPAEAVGWWQGVMDPPKPKQLIPTPNPILIERLEALCKAPDQSSLAHLLGLLLVRRRVLQPMSDEDPETADHEAYTRLVHPVTEQQFDVPNVEPEIGRLKDVQEALQAMLYTEG
ncbi:MAG: hypothetical protein SGI77_06105 [Pirellulaceae bacterium]|nr:hypothetical protein [Pirellulaceae bacterium]